MYHLYYISPGWWLVGVILARANIALKNGTPCTTFFGTHLFVWGGKVSNFPVAY